MAEISYQNNDIILKYMSAAFKDVALDFYGLHTAKIKAVIPTDLPVLEVSEESMDFVFLLEDESFLHLEFQTTNRNDNLTRFLLYDARLYKKDKRKINTAVIYSGDIEQAISNIEIGSISYQVSNVYMKAFNGDDIFLDLQNKITGKEILNDADKLNLIFLPLMKSKVGKNEMAINAVELAAKISNDNEKMLYIGAIVGISDKFIDKEYVYKLKERLKMTRVGIELRKEGFEEGIKEGKLEDASKMVKKGFIIDDIIEITGLKKEDIEKLHELNKEKH
ncbi:MAG TPA: hypothetical protein VIK72_05070 [Clostridiaceae bacterium]